ncbi:MAG: hypothetical protein KDD43_15170, partial [Bdellovibrionales bacterium]|nr:hypothetical protein [Bdellovibrionales bacterium]
MDTLVKITLLLAVAVIFPVMVALGIEAFLPGPEVHYEECDIYLNVRSEPSTETSAADYQKQQDQYQQCRKDKDAI